jgi:hypothetical protein
MTMPQYAALAIDLQRGGLCAVSPACGCGLVAAWAGEA